MKRSLFIGLALVLIALWAPTTAGAQKGVLGVGADPTVGVLSPDGDLRYTAINARSGTVLAGIKTEDGRIDQLGMLDGSWTIPAVAYDGTAGGLSADGRTLVLNEPGVRFPQRESGFKVLDTRRLRAIETVNLDGTFTFDALSPDGRSLYLIEYTSPRDLTEYRVRRYDLDRGRLDPRPIIDPDESGEEMYGAAVTRATSPDGRWAYTLYDGTEHPFIHALDTERAGAVCIDLDPGAVEPRRLYRMELEPSPDGSTLAVVDRGNPVATVDTETFDVSDPATGSAASADGEGSGGAPWLLIGLGAAGAGAFVTLLISRRRAASEVGTEHLEQLVRVEDNAEARERERVP